MLSPFAFFFFNDTATTEIYTLSLHDALPICGCGAVRVSQCPEHLSGPPETPAFMGCMGDRKSTRLNSSHSQISYAVFCLKKKKETTNTLLRDLRQQHSGADRHNNAQLV